MSPGQALEIYSDRGIIEGAFIEMKVRNDCDRMLATELTYEGKLFVYLLAQSCRRIMSLSARRNCSAGQLPGNSLDKLLARLKSVHAVRQESSRMWKVAMLTQTQRTAFSLLGVPLPTGTHQFVC